MANNTAAQLPDWTALPEGVFHLVIKHCDMNNNVGSEDSLDDEPPYNLDLQNMRLVCSAWASNVNSYPPFRECRYVTMYGGSVARVLQLFPHVESLTVWIDSIEDVAVLLELPNTVLDLEIRTDVSRLTLQRYRPMNEGEFVVIYISKEEKLPYCRTEVQANFVNHHLPEPGAYRFVSVNGVDIWPMPYIEWQFKVTLPDTGEQLLLQLSPSLQVQFDLIQRLGALDHQNLFILFPLLQNHLSTKISLRAWPSSYLEEEWCVPYLKEVLEACPANMQFTIQNWELAHTISLEPFPLQQEQVTEEFNSHIITYTRHL